MFEYKSKDKKGVVTRTEEHNDEFILPVTTSEDYLVSSTIDNSNNEIVFDEFILDAKFEPLVSALISDGITTIDKVKELSMLSYLNTKDLYDLQSRMKILEEINYILTNPVRYKKSIKQRDNGIYVDTSTDNHKSLAQSKDIQITLKLENYLKQQYQCVPFEEIVIAYPTLRPGTLRRLLASSTHIVKVRDSYIHVENIYGFYDFADIVLATLESLFSKNAGHATAFMLFNSVRARLEDFFYDNGFESQGDVFDLALHLFDKQSYLDKHFIFYNSNHIWEKEPDYPKSYLGLFIKWARENNGVISREQCHEKLEMIGAGSISANFSNTYNSAKHLFWQFGPYKFVLAEKVEISLQWKEALNERLTDLLQNSPFFPLRDIADYWFETLPPLPSGVCWTPLLLQEVVTYVEVGFRTIPAGDGQDFDAVHAAIVQKDSPLETFGDVVWIVADEDFGTPTNEISTEQLRQALVRRNILQGNERLWSLPKAIGNDLRFRWSDDSTRVMVFNL